MDSFFENLFLMFVCFLFKFTSGQLVWILKNLRFRALCRISRRWTDVCFQSQCNSLWMTGLKALAN